MTTTQAGLKLRPADIKRTPAPTAGRCKRIPPPSDSSALRSIRWLPSHPSIKQIKAQTMRDPAYLLAEKNIEEAVTQLAVKYQ
jgi:hypothetical protein